jgi:hypothetical protein
MHNGLPSHNRLPNQKDKSIKKGLIFTALAALDFTGSALNCLV